MGIAEAFTPKNKKEENREIMTRKELNREAESYFPDSLENSFEGPHGFPRNTGLLQETDRTLSGADN